MGAFGMGLVSGIDQAQQFKNQRDTIKMNKDYYSTLQKKMDLEMQMQQRQLQGQQDLVKNLFKAPQTMPVTAQGPGAPVPLQLGEADQFLQTLSPQEMAEGRGMKEIQERGPGFFKEGPQPTGQAEVPGTGGMLASASPQLQAVFQSMMDATGGDMNKTLSTLQMLAPDAFPQKPVDFELGPGQGRFRQIGDTITPLAMMPGKAEKPGRHTVKGALLDDEGNVLYQAPGDEGEDAVVVPAGGELRGKKTGTLLASNPKDATDNPKADIVEVNGVPMQVVNKDGQKTLQPLPGTPESAGKSPTNQVDQYIFAHSQGKYKNMAEAAAAGQTHLVEQAEQVVREQRPMERAERQATIMTQAQAVREREAEKIKQEQPLPQKERVDLFDRKAFLESGKLVRLPPGTSKGQAAQADVVEIPDKTRGEIQALDNAILDMNTLFDEADKLITATTWKEAKFKQAVLLHGGALSGSNAEAAAYKADVEAFSTNLARAFGHEKGVMTDQDIRRWLATLVTFGDTVQVKTKKRAMFEKIAANAVKAQRRVIAGDDLTTVRQELKEQIEPMLRDVDKSNGIPGAPPPPAHIPKEEHQAYQEAYLQAMEQMGEIPNLIDPRFK